MGYGALEGAKEKEGTPRTGTLAVLWCGVFKPQFSFLPTNLCPDSTRVSYSARRDTNSGQKQKVNYLVHPCSVFIFIVVQGSYPSCPPRLFTRLPTHPHTDTHTHTHILFKLLVGYNSRHQAFGSLILKKILLTLPPCEKKLCQVQLAVPGVSKVAVDHLAPANPSSSPSWWGSPPGGKPSWRAPGLHFPALVKKTTPNQREAPAPFPWGWWEARSWDRQLGWQTVKCWQLWKPVRVQACGLNHRPNSEQKKTSELVCSVAEALVRGEGGAVRKSTPKESQHCSSYLSSSLGLCLALIQPNDGRKRWLWDGNVQIFWVRTMRKIILIASFDWRFLKVCSAFCLCSLGPIIFSCLCPIVIFPFWKWKRQKS